MTRNCQVGSDRGKGECNSQEYMRKECKSFCETISKDDKQGDRGKEKTDQVEKISSRYEQDRIQKDEEKGRTRPDDLFRDLPEGRSWILKVNFTVNETVKPHSRIPCKKHAQQYQYQKPEVQGISLFMHGQAEPDQCKGKGKDGMAYFNKRKIIRDFRILVKDHTVKDEQQSYHFYAASVF